MQDQFGVEKAPGTDVVEKRAKNVLLESTTLDEVEIKEVVNRLVIISFVFFLHFSSSKKFFLNKNALIRHWESHASPFAVN